MKNLILTLLIGLVSPSAILHADEKSVPKEAGESHEGRGDESHEKARARSARKRRTKRLGLKRGITEADEHKGFKLSPEALKNFEIKTMKLGKVSPWTIPTTVVVRSGNEVNLFRVRDGLFKRIDFNLVRKNGSQLVISSPDLQGGDEIVTTGLGLLRIAELSAFGGLAEGHSTKGLDYD